MHGNVQTFDDLDSLLDILISYWNKVSAESISDHGGFHVALAGGSTPKGFYQRLAQRNVRSAINWNKVHVYFGDERYVPQDHADSNYRMANEALFSKVDIPPSQIHAMVNPALSPEQNGSQYADLLKQQLPSDVNGNPVFDLVLLGLGEDGHTASLFPDTAILAESKKPVAAQFVEKLGVWRVSLTYPALNAAKHIVVLVVGAGKSAIFSELRMSPSNDVRYPIQHINPQGDLQWFLDKAAAEPVVATKS